MSSVPWVVQSNARGDHVHTSTPPFRLLSAHCSQIAVLCMHTYGNPVMALFPQALARCCTVSPAARDFLTCPCWLARGVLPTCSAGSVDAQSSFGEVRRDGERWTLDTGQPFSSSGRSRRSPPSNCSGVVPSCTPYRSAERSVGELPAHHGLFFAWSPSLAHAHDLDPPAPSVTLPLSLHGCGAILVASQATVVVVAIVSR